jgi:hypothetical protein
MNTVAAYWYISCRERKEGRKEGRKDGRKEDRKTKNSLVLVE